MVDNNFVVAVGNNLKLVVVVDGDEVVVEVVYFDIKVD